MMQNKLIKTDFAIKINFDKGSENPSRIFETMSSLIKAFQEFDKDLLKSIDTKIEPVLLLEDVETSSLKTWLTSVIKGVPNGTIKELDWEKSVKEFLSKSKYILLSGIEGKDILSDPKIIDDIIKSINEEAKNTDIKSFPDYSPVPPNKIVQSIDLINKSLLNLSKTDNVTLITEHGSAMFNHGFNFSKEDMEDLITKERHDFESTMILKVKKPDYLGQSMWDFKHGAKLIPAKILDGKWLNEFQERKVDIRPGDSLRARVKTTLKYGYDASLVGQSYEILEINDVIRFDKGTQTAIDLPVED